MKLIIVQKGMIHFLFCSDMVKDGGFKEKNRSGYSAVCHYKCNPTSVPIIIKSYPRDIVQH